MSREKIEWIKPDEFKIGEKSLQELLLEHDAYLSSNDLEKRLIIINTTIENVDFTDYNINIRHGILTKVNFYNCKFGNIASAYAIFQNCIFTNCKFNKYLNLQCAIFNSCDFTKCNVKVKYPSMYLSSFNLCNFYKCKLSNVCFDHSSMLHCNFDRVSFDKCTCSDSFKNNFNTIQDCKGIPFISMSCPSDGAFIGWKKVVHREFSVYEYMLVKLQIPASAKRSSALSNKCRCDKAKVLGIYNLDGTRSKLKYVVHTTDATYEDGAIHYIDTKYEVGKYVYPDSFDEDRWEECTHGIHFFIDKQDAINYI